MGRLGWLRAGPGSRLCRRQDQLLHHGCDFRRGEHGALGPRAHVAARHCRRHDRHQPAVLRRPDRSVEIDLSASLPAVAVDAGRRRPVRRRHDPGRRLRQQEPVAPGRRQLALAGRPGLRCHFRLHDPERLVRPVALQLSRPRGDRPLRARHARPESFPSAGRPDRPAGEDRIARSDGNCCTRPADLRVQGQAFPGDRRTGDRRRDTWG